MITTILTDAAAIESLGDEWQALVQAIPSASPFLTWEWMAAWATHLGRDGDLHVVVVHDQNELVAIAPWVVSRSWVLPARLEFMGASGAGSDYLDLIVRPGYEQAAIEAIVSTLAEQPLTLYLDHLPSTSLSERLARKLTGHGWAPLRSVPDVCPFVDLHGHSFESYLDRLGSSHRANFRRRLRALNRQFTMTFELATSEEARGQLLNRLIAFHRDRWGERGSTAFATSGLRAFHHEASRRLLEAGWLRLYSLKLDDETAAVMYGFKFNRRFYFYQHGFDARFAPYGAGLVLMGITIKAAIEDDCVEFDMLYGHEPYKYLWAQTEYPLERLQLFPSRLAGKLQRRHAETRRAVRAMVRHAGASKSHAHT